MLSVILTHCLLDFITIDDILCRICMSSLIAWLLVLAFLQGMDKLGSTSSKSMQSDSASSQTTTPPSTPLRVLRRSGSSHGSGGGSFRHNSSGLRTLMFFKGCPRPLGCTVLLKGADAQQLVLLKKVTKVPSAALQPTGH